MSSSGSSWGNLLLDNAPKIASGVKSGAQWGWENSEKVADSLSLSLSFVMLLCCLLFFLELFYWLFD